MPDFQRLPPLSPSSDKSHHKGNPPTGFKNPWPSFPTNGLGLPTLFQTRFGNKPPFVPIPTDRSELVEVLKPDFSPPPIGEAFKVTWIGHASFLVQCRLPDSQMLNILLDPVFSERTSPVSFLGPKRYTPTPCSIEELLDAVAIDVVCISHNHYDHADTSTLRTIYQHRGGQVLFCVALGNPRWLTPLGIPRNQIWEADWWDRIDVAPSAASDKLGQPVSSQTSSTSLPLPPNVRINCTPCQHASARSPFDRDCDLWCSFAIQVLTGNTIDNALNRSLYFSGDTGYRTVPPQPDPFPASDLPSLPHCPAFSEIGKQLGPFDLALLPIGLCHPRQVMSPVHCNPEDSMCIHRDVKAKRSVGMHYGTVRGGLSQYYEDVRVPPREWRAVADELGLRFRSRDSGNDWDVGLMAVGEALVV